MALFKNVGSILKQNISQCSALSMLNSARYMSTKLFVGGLSYSTDDNSLRDAFSQHGEVVEARVIMDRETRRSRGFGFVEYTDSDSANAAVGSMDGQELHGRNIRVNVANDRPSAMVVAAVDTAVVVMIMAVVVVVVVTKGKAMVEEMMTSSY